MCRKITDLDRWNTGPAVPNVSAQRNGYRCRLRRRLLHGETRPGYRARGGYVRPRRVSQIIAFGTMAAKAVIRDVGRVLGHPKYGCRSYLKLVPPDPGMTLAKAFEAEPQLPGDLRADEEALIAWRVSWKG